MHADYSCDAEMTLKEARVAAKAAGLGMILTEHWDRDYPTNPESFIFDINDYFKKNAPYRSDTVLLGIEMGLQPHTIEDDRIVAKSHPFDEIVGSMHCYRGQDMYERTTYDALPKIRPWGTILRIPSNASNRIRTLTPMVTSTISAATGPMKIRTSITASMLICGTRS